MLSIRHDSIESTRIDSLVSIRRAGSRFARDLTNIARRDYMQCGLTMLSIRLDSIESTRIVQPVVDSSSRTSIYVRLNKYSAPGLCLVV